MPGLGSPRNNAWNIGTAELRVGPLTSANKLMQSNSVGLVDNVNIDFSSTIAKLMGGFPRRTVDTAVTEYLSSITATLREHSRRNLNLLVGGGAGGSAVDFSCATDGTLVAAEATSITVETGKGGSFSVGDLIGAYNNSTPEEVMVLRVASIAGDVLTLDTGTPVLFDLKATADGGATIYKAHAIALGGYSTPTPVSVGIVQKDPTTGRPIGANFWKGIVTSGLKYNTSNEYGTLDLTIEVLEPAASEYGTGQPLEHLKNIIPTHPIGMIFRGGD